MRQLSLLLVGTGRMAQQHAERYASIPGVQVVAAVDIDEKRLTQFCSDHAIPEAFTDISQALSECQVDAASIVTPDAWHAQGSIACFTISQPNNMVLPFDETILMNGNNIYFVEN